MKIKMTPMVTGVVTTLAVAALGFLIVRVAERSHHKEHALNTDSVEVTDSLVRSELMESVYDHIFQLRLEHPRIVMAQCVLESGAFTSALFREGNNCLGMKLPGRRPTTAVGTCRGHARFRSWRDCITDYALWQSAYGRGLTEEEYLSLLDRIYAEDGSYSRKIRSVIRDYGL